MVIAPVFQIDGLVGDMPGAADNVLTTLACHLAQMFLVLVHESLFGGVIAAIGHQEAGDAKAVVVSLQETRLMIALGKAQAVHDRFGYLAAIESYAGKTVLFGIQEVTLITFRIEDTVIQFEAFGLEVLNADDIGILLGQPVEKASPDCFTDAIDIYGCDFHTWSL